MQSTAAALNLGRMVEAVSAVRAWRELLVLAGAGLLATAIFAAAAYLGMKGSVGQLVALLLGLLGIGAMTVGYVAVAARFTDEARSLASRTLMSAVMDGLMSLPKLLLTGLIFLALLLVEIIIGLLLLLLCKIPGIGPALNFLIVPLLSLVFGATLYTLVFIAFPLTVCSLTEGKSVMQTVSLIVATVRTRLAEVLLMGVVLLLIVGVVASTLSLIAFMGLGMTTGLSGVVGVGGGGLFSSADPGMMVAQYGGNSALEEMMRESQRSQGYGGGLLTGGLMGSVMSSMAGAGLLFLILGGLYALIYIKGWSLIYVQIADSLDLSGTEKFLQEKVQQAKDKAAQAKARVEEEARKRREQTQQSRDAQAAAQDAEAATRARAVVAAPAPAALVCKSCKAEMTAEDRFCPECGAAN